MSGQPTPRPGTPDPIPLFRELEALKTEEPALAQPMDRLLARLIDFGCIAVIFIAVSFALYGAIAEPVAGPGVEPERPNPNRAESWVALVAALAAVGLFLTIAEIWPAWRSPGKRVISLYIVQATGFDPPSLPRRLFRCVAWSVPVLGSLFLWSISFLTPWGLGMMLLCGLALAIPGWMYLDNDHRGLHDKLAGTRVVVDRH